MKVQYKKESIGNQWMFDIAKSINENLPGKAEVRNDKVIFSENIATGYVAYHKLSEDIEVAIYNHTYNVPFWMERLATEETKFYSMRLNCSPSEIAHFADGEETKIGGPTAPSVFWSASDVSSSVKIEEGEHCRGIVVYISKAYLQHMLGDATFTIQAGKLQTADDETHVISRNVYSGIGSLQQQLVEEILDMEQNPSVFEKIWLKANILKVLALFVKRLVAKDEISEQSANFSDTARILEIKKLIDDKAGTDQISLDDLAKSAAFSKTKLKTKFKEIVGKTAYQYYLDVKMEKARSILEDCTMPITELAYELGFKSTSYFSQAFKKYYGVTPTAIALRAS
jgi:AraC-like DNA-binding protein